jgi:hypothetical protein
VQYDCKQQQDIAIPVAGWSTSQLCTIADSTLLLQSDDFDLEFIRVSCRPLAAAVRDEALGWVKALRDVMRELDSQLLEVSSL